jgi:hypothetical protein
MISEPDYPQAVLAWLGTRRSAILSRRSVQLWNAIDEELSPLIGTNGFVALYSRCLDLGGTSFPWLRNAPGHSSPARLFEELGEQLTARAAAEAAEASRVLFETFHKLLLLMIGPSLTEAVLDAAWRDRLPQRPARFALKAVSPIT